MSIAYREAKVIAEIGCNHMGDLQNALMLIDAAAEAGAQIAKFQKRHPRSLLTQEQYHAPHPVPSNSYGTTYGEHREYLELDLEQHAVMKEYCSSKGITYCTSVWDLKSAREIISLDPEFIKVPSACNNNVELLECLRDEYSGDVHVSFGMTTEIERQRVVDTFAADGSAKERLVLYSCTSGYPVPASDVYLLQIAEFIEKYDHQVKDIGFSGHHLGIAIDIAAYTLGARWIERHFTLDRTWKGTDHAASLEPGGLKKLVRDLDAVYKALKYRSEEILPIEAPQRAKLKYQDVK